MLNFQVYDFSKLENLLGLTLEVNCIVMEMPALVSRDLLHVRTRRGLSCLLNILMTVTISDLSNNFLQIKCLILNQG